MAAAGNSDHGGEKKQQRSSTQQQLITISALNTNFVGLLARVIISASLIQFKTLAHRERMLQRLIQRITLELRERCSLFIIFLQSLNFARFSLSSSASLLGCFFPERSSLLGPRLAGNSRQPCASGSRPSPVDRPRTRV